jgi:four helix bundle protein
MTHMLQSPPNLAAMRPHRRLALVDAAEQFAADIVRLIDSTPRLLHKAQLLKSSQSVSSNIGEGLGRITVPDRNSRFAIARGEAEETLRHLRANVQGSRITLRQYWPFHNRAVTIVKMINSFLK